MTFEDAFSVMSTGIDTHGCFTGACVPRLPGGVGAQV